jgi:protein-disulfide isomerase
MSMSLERIASAAIAVAAIAIAAVVVRREFFPPATVASGRRVLPAPVEVSNWKSLRAHGAWVGDSNARVVIVEFADFECPFCERFHREVKSAKAQLGERGGDVALLYIHLPLGSHRFAMPAALASVCAAEQGSFGAFHSALFEKQDSFGLKSWTSYAVDAGVPDTATFSDCTRERKSAEIVTAGLRVADSMGINVTPTILINGWKYAIPPIDSLVPILNRLLASEQ